VFHRLHGWSRDGGFLSVDDFARDKSFSGVPIGLFSSHGQLLNFAKGFSTITPVGASFFNGLRRAVHDGRDDPR
jgi:hypothetical protein